MNLITRLASVGQPKACFKARMSAVFMEDHGTVMPWLDMLEHTAESGNELAKYVLSLVLHRSNNSATNDATARRLLRKVKCDEAGPTMNNATWKNKNCARRCQQARVVLQDDLVVPRRVARLDLPPLAHQVPRQDGHQCRCRGYGDIAGWVAWEQWALFFQQGL